MKKPLIWVLLLVIVLGIVYWFINQNTVEQPINELATDYIGLNESQAEILATQNGVPFRVVERDGEMLPTTRDYRLGRINALVENGVVTTYTVEGGDTTPTVDTTALHDAIIGLTSTEAGAYATEKGVPFRIGSVDGEARPVTLDYLPGRITADVVDGFVTAYTTE